eukprot:1688436-Amphidinium_carterae.1
MGSVGVSDACRSTQAEVPPNQQPRMAHCKSGVLQGPHQPKGNDLASSSTPPLNFMCVDLSVVPTQPREPSGKHLCKDEAYKELHQHQGPLPMK